MLEIIYAYIHVIIMFGIIEMDKKKNNYAVENEKLFFNIIRDSFKFKRK